MGKVLTTRFPHSLAASSSFLSSKGHAPQRRRTRISLPLLRLLFYAQHAAHAAPIQSPSTFAEACSCARTCGWLIMSTAGIACCHAHHHQHSHRLRIKFRRTLLDAAPHIVLGLKRNVTQQVLRFITCPERQGRSAIANERIALTKRIERVLQPRVFGSSSLRFVQMFSSSYVPGRCC